MTRLQPSAETILLAAEPGHLLIPSLVTHSANTGQAWGPAVGTQPAAEQVDRCASEIHLGLSAGDQEKLLQAQTTEQNLPEQLGVDRICPHVPS